MIASPEDLIALAVRQAMRDLTHRPLVIGICGAQGSGKSTVAGALSKQFQAAPVLSLDDLYLPRTDRQNLAAAVHPLLATRGVPGTHDVALGLDVLKSLSLGERVRLPRFDKRSDDRVPEARWPLAEPGYEIAIVEGWCLGATPQAEVDLVEPVNRLEAEDDADGRWRRYVNRQLAGPYQVLFAGFDLVAFLAAPSFEVVYDWRRQQEVSLRLAAPVAEAAMDDETLVRFVAHFERLTRHLLATMPSRANVIIDLDRYRRSARSYCCVRPAWGRGRERYDECANLPLASLLANLPRP